MASIWFDLDGTLYELYKIPNWLERLEEKDWNVFVDGKPRKHHERIREAVRALQAKGWKVGCITWGSKGITEEEELQKIAEKKKEFLAKYFPELLENFYCLPYGTSKVLPIMYGNWYMNRVSEQPNYLVDDNKMVRKNWRTSGQEFGYKTINASRSFVRELEALAE